MSIKIKTIARKNPVNRMEASRYYAQSISSGMIDLNELANLISDGSTVRRNDIYAVLVGLTDAMIKELKKGHSVRFGELGIFRPSVQSNSVDNPDEVSASLITGCKVRFRAGIAVKEALKSVRYVLRQ